MVTCYAAGYLFAALRAPLLMKGLERTNVLVACVIVVAVLSLFSPLADPARISVADQLSRLQSGAVPPERFDFAFLRFDSGRYGRMALERLAAATDGPGCALLDADLAILGAASDEYDRYAAAIRREYAWVDENAYRAGRSQVLQGFLHRPCIFHTADWAARAENPARCNLQREIDALAAQ